MLEAEQRAQNVGIKRGGIALCSLVDDQTGLPLGTGDVDGHVEVAEAGHCLVDQTPDFFVVPYVGLHENGLRAEPLQFDFESLTFGRTATANNETSADLGKCQGGCATDAGQGTSNEDNGVAHDLTPVRYY